MRHPRLVMLVLAALFLVTVPTAHGQTPVADQYETMPARTADDNAAAEREAALAKRAAREAAEQAEAAAAAERAAAAAAAQARAAEIAALAAAKRAATAAAERAAVAAVKRAAARRAAAERAKRAALAAAKRAAAARNAAAAAAENRAVAVSKVSPARLESLPFTGGHSSLLALIGLGLLALGAFGIAATRVRRAENDQPREGT